MWQTSELAKWWYGLQILIGFVVLIRFGATPLSILVGLGTVLNCVSLYRCCVYAELDDLHPLMQCDKLDKFMEHPRLRKMWVVPWYNGVPITHFPEWCAKLKAWADADPQRVLGLHGFEHSDHECARIEITDKHIERANNVFLEAFGEYPTEFKAPNYALSHKNRDFLEARGFTIASKGEGMFHQVFHCNTDYCWWDCKDIVQAHV